MSELLLTPDRLLWHVRGRYWGYEFLCLPQGIEADWYQAILQPLELQTGQTAPQHFTAALAGRRLVGVRKDDEQLCDHASRPVSHTAAWILPDGLACEHVPADWFDQFYRTVQGQFSSERFYGMPDDEVRQRWQRREPLGRSLRQELLATLQPVRLLPGAPTDSYTSLDMLTTEKPSPRTKQRSRLTGLLLLALAFVAVVVSVAVLSRR